jgi:hypothetical protein
VRSGRDLRPIVPPRCCRTWLACRALMVLLWLAGWAVYAAGAHRVSGWLMIAGLAAYAAGEQVDRVARLVWWARRRAA